MAEAFPTTDPESFIPPEGPEKRKKRRKRKNVGGLGAIAAEAKAPRAPERRPKETKISLDAIFGIDTAEALKEGERKTPKETVISDDKPEREGRDASEEVSESTDTERLERTAGDDASPSRAAEHAEVPFSRELRPGHELNGGEVVIKLHDRDLAEREAELPLKPEATAGMGMAAETAADRSDGIIPESAEIPATEEMEAPETPSPVRETRSASVESAVESATTEEPVPPLETGRGRGGGTRPPVPPHVYAGGAAEEYTPPVPTEAASGGADLLRQMRDTELQARKRGRGEGLLAGLLVGGGIEHTRHKRRERKMNRALRQQEKAHAKDMENSKWDRIREQIAERARATESRKYEAISRPVVTVSAAERAFSSSQPPAERLTTSARTSERLQDRNEAARLTPEDRSQIPPEQLEKGLTAEQLAVPEGHHVETSAWHAIEVDERGHAVEKPTFSYGHEYYRERARETGPKTQSDIQNAAGEVALVAAALSAGQDGAGSAAGSASKPTGHTAPAKPAATSAKDMVRRAARSMTTPPDTADQMIPWIILLILLFITIFAVM